MKPTAYEGKLPYVFISYAHSDEDRVFEIVSELDKQGCRVWYDEGITPGSEWPEDVASHLNNAAMLMAFVSNNSMKSENCRREINFALSKNKPFLSVVLEQTDMPLGMEMQLSAHRSILRYNYATWEDFIGNILKCPSLAPCRGEAAQESVQPTKAPAMSDTDRELKLLALFRDAAVLHEKDDITGELNLLLSNRELGANSASYMVKVGRAYRRLGMTPKALEYYEEAKKLNPKDPTIYSNTAIAYVTAGQYADAKPYFEKAVELAEAAPLSVSAGDFASIYGNFARCVGLMGDIRSAKKYLKIAKEKGYNEAYFNDVCKTLGINPKSIGRRFFF